MKSFKKTIAFIAATSILLSSVVSCGEIKATSDGRLCFVDYGCDDEHNPCENVYIYDKSDSDAYESFSFRSEDFGCDTRDNIVNTGTLGHGDDLLYLNSGIRLFCFDKNGNYENIINYTDMLPERHEINAAVVLENNSVLVSGSGYSVEEDCYKTVIYKFIANE